VISFIPEPLGYCEEQEVQAEEWVSSIMKSVVQYHAEAQEELRGMFGTAYIIDEMALMFTSPAWALRWISSAVRIPGMTLFNSANDHVQTRPVPSRYDVHYWFLSSPFTEGVDEPGEERWRIECMYPHPGSPLHDAYRRMMRRNDVMTMHASFKGPDEEAYGVAVKTLRDNGYEAAQLCTSTYGRFSYWLPQEDEDGSGVYLKPRVNLRDAVGEDLS